MICFIQPNHNCNCRLLARFLTIVIAIDVAGISVAIAVRVSLLRVLDKRTIVAGVAQVVVFVASLDVVGIRLETIWRQRTVVEPVRDPVTV